MILILVIIHFFTIQTNNDRKLICGGRSIFEIFKQE